MIFKNLFRLNPYFSNQARRQLKWRFNDLGAQIHLKDPNFPHAIAFHALPNIKFSQFFMALAINQRNVNFPEGINQQTEIINFLAERQNPKAIQIKRNGQSLFLRNKACDSITQDIITNIRDPKSIYQQIQKFNQTNKPQSFTQLSNYLIRYYLKLQAQFYCKVNKIQTQNLMTAKLKEQLMYFLNKKNQVNCHFQLENVYKEQINIERSILQTQLKINEINESYEKRQNWYKRMAILITIIHIVGYSYMIFGVNWLGWDIVEPLTYTVGVVYTLIGIRFYRKYKVDRSAESIRQALFKMIMPPEKRVLLKENLARLQIQKKQLKRNKQEQLILKNRLAYNTSLIQSIKNSV